MSAYRIDETSRVQREISFRRKLLCWMGRHLYVWRKDSALRIPAQSIGVYSTIDSVLTCEFCPKTVGPLKGKSMFDEVKKHGLTPRFPWLH